MRGLFPELLGLCIVDGGVAGGVFYFDAYDEWCELRWWCLLLLISF